MTSTIQETGSLHGVWEVTTEGDCEGRSTTRLGVWEGWMDEIALHLADEVMYSLNFRRIDPKRGPYTPTSKKVSVTISGVTGGSRMHTSELARTVQQIFDLQQRDVEIQAGGGYNAFTIVGNKETEKERVERLKAEARERLEATMSAEDIKLLGL